MVIRKICCWNIDHMLDLVEHYAALGYKVDANIYKHVIYVIAEW